MTSTHARRQALRALLERGVRGTQAQLCDELARLGHDTTQSTISRDLRVLGATRSVDGDGAWVHQLPTRISDPRDRPPAALGGMVEEIDRNEVLVVVRTLAGRAPAVGIEIDALRDPEILGGQWDRHHRHRGHGADDGVQDVAAKGRAHAGLR